MKIEFILPEITRTVFDRFKKAGYEIYLVGGAVRDLFLKKELKDCDFATNANPDDVQRLFSKTIYNNNYGTVTVIFEDGQTAEITSYRREAKYDDFRHPKEIIWAKTIEEDLRRRDFTINAIAHNGKDIIDPFGGIDDINSKTIRAVGSTDRRFREDSLRLIRAVRFASQLEFLIDTSTFDSIKKNSQLIQHISGERIRDELLKILSSPHPGDGVMLLKNAGLLSYILPEVDKCFGVEQKSPGRHHIDDVGTHLIKSLNVCTSSDSITRLATLLHDIGKAQTFKKDEKTNLITFYNHEFVGAEQSKEIAKRLRFSKEDTTKLTTLVRFHMFTVSERQTDKAIKRFIRNVGVENLDEAIAMRVADRVGSGATETSWRTELFKKRLVEVQQEPFSIKDLKINGNDIMKELGIKPGPQVGKILQDMFEKVDEGKLKNEKEELIKAIKNS